MFTGKINNPAIFELGVPHGNGKSHNSLEPFRYTIISDALHPMELLGVSAEVPVFNDDDGSNEEEETAKTDETEDRGSQDAELARRCRERRGHHDSHTSEYMTDNNEGE